MYPEIKKIPRAQKLRAGFSYALWSELVKELDHLLLGARGQQPRSGPEWPEKCPGTCQIGRDWQDPTLV